MSDPAFSLTLQTKRGPVNIADGRHYREPMAPGAAMIARCVIMAFLWLAPLQARAPDLDIVDELVEAWGWESERWPDDD